MNHNFIERSIMGVLSFLKESVFAEEYANKNGFLQSLDPRVKLATILLLIIQVLFTKSIAVLSFFYIFCLVLSSASNVRIGFFLKRTWVFIPLFSLFIAIPALFSFLTPGETLLSFSLAGTKLTITRQGVAGSSFFVMRVATSVSFAVLLTLTTRHFELLGVLRFFKIPQVFVMILGMCYRYLYLFIETIEHTYRSIKSRVGICVHYKHGQHIVAWNISCLWQRSYRLSEEVYRAMLSRGYSGEPRTIAVFKVRPRDIAWLFFVIGITLALLYINRILLK